MSFLLGIWHCNRKQYCSTGSCHEPTALLSVPDLTCKAKKPPNFPCWQSLDMSRNTLYNKGSQEALQTRTNYIKLYTQRWNCALYETGCSSGPIFAFSLRIFKDMYNTNAPMFLLSKLLKQSLYSNTLRYVSVEQRILNESNEIQTEELFLPKL